MVIPCYENPSDTNAWNSLTSGIPGYLILNPDSGPGPSKDSSWTQIVDKAQAVNTSVVGYVYTHYGNRILNDVESDIDKYYEWYGVDGIFFDEASSQSNDISYYQTLYKYVKSKSSSNTKNKVIINPGDVPTIGYDNNCADIIVAFESSVNEYYKWNPLWTNSSSINVEISHMIYNIDTQLQMENVVNISRTRNAQYIFVCNSDSYNSLPSYWDQQVKYIQNECK